MLKPRKFKSRSLNGLELGPNPNYAQSVWFGIERGLWHAPAEFLRLFGFCFLLVLAFIAFLVIGIPVWIVAQIGVAILGIMGKLRPDSDAPYNQSVVS